MLNDLKFIEAKKHLESINNDSIEKYLKNETQFIRETRGGFKGYKFRFSDSHTLMTLVSLLRTVGFAQTLGKINEVYDVDNYDQGDFQGNHEADQLIIYDTKGKKIAGSYRVIDGKEIIANNLQSPSTLKLFNPSDKFVDEILPYSKELGRSVILPEYQRSFALFGLLGLIGAEIADNPESKFLYGKLTRTNLDSQKENNLARDLISSLFEKYYLDENDYLAPKENFSYSNKEIKKVLTGYSIREDKEIIERVTGKKLEMHVPMIGNYNALSDQMVANKPMVNQNFGNADEFPIIKDMAFLFEKVIRYHITSYKPESKINNKYILQGLKTNQVNL